MIRQPDLGVLEWFCVGEHARVERVIDSVRALDISHLRTGLSWADWHVPEGREWYRWLLPKLASHFELLPCVLYTPPSVGILPKASSPPKRARDYADFIDVAIDEFGDLFEYIELWNEPNNLSEWDWTVDPEWVVFADMVVAASYWARHRGKKTVLGGMSPPDPNWLALMSERGAMDHINVIGIHGFPGTWEATWRGWDIYIEEVRTAFPGAAEKDVWITEAGYSTWRHDEFRQLQALVDAIGSKASRVYWYSAEDLAPERQTVDGFHTDEREYHFGLRRHDGQPKLLHRIWQTGGLDTVRNLATVPRRHAGDDRNGDRRTLITGGAGFVGVNVAHRLLEAGKPVTILDSLSRPGVERNLAWLTGRHEGLVRVEIADVRDRYAIRSALRECDEVFHFAAQVAVTTSIDDPRTDFAVNLQGTLNLLEEMRRLPDPPSLLFTSTNKVYGDLADVRLRELPQHYAPIDPWIAAHGIDENRPLSFCSPYGCSKGGADQYVLDYANTFGLKAVVFRMSCIYGPHQFGTEDQGWVAHFLIRALTGEPLTLYGDGKQVRDILFVDDLVDAMLLAQAQIDRLSGKAFNIGGGATNTVSLLRVIDMIEAMTDVRPEVEFEGWRLGDQRYYVSDLQRFCAATGWRPSVDVENGLARLWDWLSEQVGDAAPLILGTR